MTRTVILALMLAGLGWAQKPKPKAAPPPKPEITVELYREAKAALGAVPAQVEPEDLMAIAGAESIRHPKPALLDYAQAFRDAVALAAPEDDNDPIGKWDEYVKRYVELEVVAALTKMPHGFALAHTLARQADIPRARLYTELIGAANAQALEQAGRTFPAEQGLLARTFGGIGFQPKYPKHPLTSTPDYDVLELAQECYQADGSFPFLGVAIALQSYSSPGVDQRPLLLLAYQRVAEATTSNQIHAATAVLTTGHKLYPDLDAQMEAAAEALLGHMAAELSNDRYPVEAKADGNFVLGLLEQVDATRAQELHAQYSMFSVPAKDLERSFPISALTAPQRQANADPSSALAGADHMPTISDQEKDAKFRKLVDLANMLAQNNPCPAATAAAQALEMMDDAMLDANLRRVALMALRMKKYLHQPGQAGNLMRQILDATEKQAVAKEKTFDGAGAAQQEKLAGDFEGNGADIVDLWAYASQVDLNLAIARAQQTGADYFKALFLERIAVGQEMLHPWWN